MMKQKNYCRDKIEIKKDVAENGTPKFFSVFSTVKNMMEEL